MSNDDEIPPRHKHGRPIPGGQGFWWVDRLWAHAEPLPSFHASVDDIAEFDVDCWFGDWAEPTCRAVAAHARRMAKADLRFPIILSSSGVLFDGAHRVAKAWMIGQSTVLAVQFEEDPEPDWVERDLPDGDVNASRGSQEDRGQG